MTSKDNNPEPQKMATDNNTKASNEPNSLNPPTASIASIGNKFKYIIAASKRGRSHAHEGKPRDDHFDITITSGDWYVGIVADGAGSAPFSREGSRIACETASRVCVNHLEKLDQVDFELLTISILPESQERTNSESPTEYNNKLNFSARQKKEIGDILYNIFGQAALQTYKEIKSVANAKNRNAKDYATTLLMAICKKMRDGWFVASFWVGDGAIGLYNKEKNSVKLLCSPDEGEFSGQTRFITMPEIFSSAENIYKRIRFCMVDDFSSLMLMTDGVSDAFFETDKNLESPDKWRELLDNIEYALKGEDNHTPSPLIQSKRLLKWLDFWSPGNHDDRTIVIVH